MINSSGEYTKLYYSVGEVAKMLHVAPSLIRYYEHEFKSIRPKKNRKGNRLFTAKDIELIKYVYYLVKEKGYTLEGAKKIVGQGDETSNGSYHTLQTLKKIRQFLTDLRDQL